MLGAVAMDSCNMIHESVIDTETVPFTFVLKTVEQTKAIADASNIDILYWQVFDTDVETAAAPMAEGVVRDSDGDGRFTLDLSLILNQTYNFIFWAQDEQPAGAEHYDVTDLRRVSIVTYDDELANDETRAAFYAYEQLHITGTLSHEVTLYRPRLIVRNYHGVMHNMVGRMGNPHKEQFIAESPCSFIIHNAEVTNLPKVLELASVPCLLTDRSHCITDELPNQQEGIPDDNEQTCENDPRESEGVVQYIVDDVVGSFFLPSIQRTHQHPHADNTEQSVQPIIHFYHFLSFFVLIL